MGGKIERLKNNITRQETLTSRLVLYCPEVGPEQAWMLVFESGCLGSNPALLV